MKRPRQRLTCWACGKTVGVHADKTLWRHSSKPYGPVCAGSGQDPVKAVAEAIGHAFAQLDNVTREATR